MAWYSSSRIIVVKSNSVESLIIWWIVNGFGLAIAKHTLYGCNIVFLE